MTLAEHYADLAENFRAKADRQKNQALRAEWEQLAECYELLAKQSLSFDESEQLNLLGELMS